jgi:beta-glucosidase
MTTGRSTSSDDLRLHGLLEQLTLEEKVQLLTGRDFWTTHPIERIGLRRILVSDGPSGVRGEVWDERSPSLNLPSASALSASWDTDLARRYGAVAAVEARRKGVDVVLGPTINLHRSPLGGRHFEAFSEDPVLTADLAAAYVHGVQDNGVGATPKHYIANDYETDRFTASTEVSDRALRELYLLAFEKSIVEAHAWLVMSSYNSVNGTTVTEHELLETPLNSEWGFDGVVISDWTAVRSVESANASQDLVMPGPASPWGDALVDAVRGGHVPEAAVDRKVLRLLQLAARVGALEGFEPVSAEPTVVEDGVAFVREAAAAGTVLVRNESALLPLDTASVRSIAVIGHNARFARTQGGGSATVLPEKVVTPIEGIEEAFPDADVVYSVGAVVQQGVAELPLERLENPITGEPGVRVSFLADGRELFAEDRRATALVWFGGDAPIGRSDIVRFSTRYMPEVTGQVLLGVASAGHSTIAVDGQLILDDRIDPVGDDLGAAFLAPPSQSVPVEVTEGQPIDIVVEHTIEAGPLSGALSFTFGLEPDDSDPEGLLAAAAGSAAAADIAIVVVGTNSKVESEGYDRESLDLPGRQDELVRRVAAANPRTVVVVNSGSPVAMPWRKDVAALLLTWFGGQEYGHALGDVLTGAVEPGGRLPTTWPAETADTPVLDVTPVEGKVAYSEGVHIGYRAWLRGEAQPAYEFGHGLGYTTWDLSDLTAPASTNLHDNFFVTVRVANTGARHGKHVVQLYASRGDSRIDRPVRWLVGFATVTLDAGSSARVTIDVPARAFADWRDGAWQYEPGDFTLHAGSSVTELPLTAVVALGSTHE